jgi:hypothetical protein
VFASALLSKVSSVCFCLVFVLQARVAKAGGPVLYWNGHRVMGVLAMSRAIGDHCLRPYVIPEPEVRQLGAWTVAASAQLAW